VDFNLNEQEKMLQRMAKEFATNSVEPQAAEIDRSGQFPRKGKHYPPFGYFCHPSYMKFLNCRAAER